MNISSGGNLSPQLIQLAVFARGTIFPGKSCKSISSLNNMTGFSVCRSDLHVLSDTFPQKVIHAGEVLFQHPQNPIDYERVNSSDREVSYRYMLLHRNIHIENLFGLDQTKVFRCRNVEIIMSLFDEIHRIISRTDLVDEGTLSVKIFEFLTRLHMDIVSPQVFSGCYDNLLTLVKTYPQNYHSLAALQNLFDVSDKKLIKIFLQNTGMTPMAFVIYHRLINSCWMLCQTQMSIEEIALKNGYRNPAFYSRAFKETFGISPLKYRQNGKLLLPGQMAKPKDNQDIAK